MRTTITSIHWRRARPGATAVVVLAASLLLGSCATASRPFAPLPPQETPTAAWTSLRQTRDRFDGARSFARLRVQEGERVRSLRGRLLVDPRGRMLLEGITPLGTAAFTLYADGPEATWLDHVHGTHWKGRLGEIARFFGERAEGGEMGLLMLALPVDSGAVVVDEGSPLIAVGSEGSRYVISETGLSSVDIPLEGDRRVVVAYDPPSFPPRNVRISYEVSSRTHAALEITHLDLSSASIRIEPPRIPPHYVPSLPPGVAVQ
ncbi:MAG TPA: hypothetical protein VMT00_13410 [Thermoanaerobaculia bacterium]|nr:hypothetical protein [Thermoanaerobaculia bacterium]